MNILKSIIIWIICLCFMAITFLVNFIIWFLVFPFDRERAVIHWLLVYQGVILSRLIRFWKIDIKGREKIVRGTTYVIISNHQSILDTLFINNLKYRFKWISKIENFKVPVIGWYLSMADYITVDRGNEESKVEMLEKSLKCLKRGISLMIFPEGTRSHNTEIGFFKRGAFQLAIQADVPILPVIIDGTGGILPKHGLIFGIGYNIKIRVLDPVLPASFQTDIPDDLALKISLIMKAELKKLRTKNIVDDK
jgi:1-acyl-sn-glycerol-3-phosphate acyltransferase